MEGREEDRTGEGVKARRYEVKRSLRTRGIEIDWYLGDKNNDHAIRWLSVSSLSSLVPLTMCAKRGPSHSSYQRHRC